MARICPNYEGCRLVQTDIVVPDSAKKAQYIASACQEEETWKKCKRYIIRKSLWFCPDFVLPDTNMTEDEIIDLYEDSEKQT